MNVSAMKKCIETNTTASNLYQRPQMTNNENLRLRTAFTHTNKHTFVVHIIQLFLVFYDHF